MSASVLHLHSRLQPIFNADYRFFTRRPDRDHRVRIAGLVEIEEARLRGAFTIPAPHGYRFFVGIRRETNGLQRAIGAGSEGTDTDRSEDACRIVFRHLLKQSDKTLRRLAAQCAKKDGRHE